MPDRSHPRIADASKVKGPILPRFARLIIGLVFWVDCPGGCQETARCWTSPPKDRSAVALKSTLRVPSSC